MGQRTQGTWLSEHVPAPGLGFAPLPGAAAVLLRETLRVEPAPGDHCCPRGAAKADGSSFAILGSVFGGLGAVCSHGPVNHGVLFFERWFQSRDRK